MDVGAVEDGRAGGELGDNSRQKNGVDDVELGDNRRRESGVDGGGRRSHAPGFDANKNDTLLVVATLITALTYQLGTNVPGGYWQDDAADGSHAAGDPIMRDKNRLRYWLFMAASWAGFGSSMLLTLGLLTGVPSRSRAVQWPFVVSYSSLVLTFITSQSGTSLAMDVLISAAVMAVLAVGIKYRRLDRLRFWFCPPAPSSHERPHGMNDRQQVVAANECQE
uniref:PGG domain-containing protein n=1 Tax=Oryza meridionalis TaxID=40149 RepID=A0A0E0C042_9ORYZ